MINPKSYDNALAAIEDSMAEARRLGLFRTAHLLHKALEEGRSERFEAQPQVDLTIEFTVGPIREQKAPSP
jgi:hypothetical protein